MIGRVLGYEIVNEVWTVVKNQMNTWFIFHNIAQVNKVRRNLI